MKEIKEKAEQMLQQCEVVTIASINENGYPRPVPMSKIKSEGYSTVWMSTGNDSLKTKDFRLNPKAGLCYSDKGNSVALTGKVEVITDADTKKEFWQDWFIEHFPLGPTDPNYIILKFKGQNATIWIDGVFIHD
ncbi:pyridoxamine 5'-phosphate oxidase family protein [uncultured Parabacteroides sp.]|uniref:pyridoxamine 5'-phosphate oxidase family protein n=1 Tax=uncultured Parabacteroides sp. TaxID=512312 RepID=UPI0025EF987C|nr:pyridoxamine 5'-phosphate oxidase family protein [uncultured Parabacteroides sp.]